jgi:REP element-mobilizing transposase RayT
LNYNRAIHHRRSIRLKGYDYSQAGAYFITICTHERERLFGEIADGDMHFSQLGQIAAACWRNLPKTFSNLEMGEWVIMPNHVHGILIIHDPIPGAGWGKGEASAAKAHCTSANTLSDASPQQGRPHGTAPGSVGAIVQNYKSVTTRKINRIHTSAGSSIWQRNYYEHIIRDEKSHWQIAEYILSNPLKWKDDQLYNGDRK